MHKFKAGSDVVKYYWLHCCKDAKACGSPSSLAAHVLRAKTVCAFDKPSSHVPSCCRRMGEG